MFQKQSADKYGFILGSDLLQTLGFIINYNAVQFMWDDIAVNMVPNGYWMKQMISNTAETWNAPQNQYEKNWTKHELHLAKILPEDYKPVDISDVINKQTHLTSKEQDLLKNVLFEFQDLFQGR